jgi:site-specific recombinase XerD
MTLEYLFYLTKTLQCSRVKAKMAAQSIAFFFKQVLCKPYQIPGVLYPAHSNKLPAVMSTDEVRQIINSIENIKHKTIISLLYSTGMRLNEAANLKMEDIDSKTMRIKVVDGKGKKDRYVPLSIQLLQELRLYYIQYKPKVYLFNSSKGGIKYSPRSIQHILQQALIKLGLQSKNYSIHTLRHSFATHLLDNGADLQVIQQLMGHHHIAQTVQYLHLTDKRFKTLVNPYDLLFDTAGAVK